MAMTPYRGIAPNQAQSISQYQSMDPANSPIGKLRGNSMLADQMGYSQDEIEKKYQYGMAQQQFAAEKPAGMDAISERYGAYGNNIPSMRNSLLKLPNTRAQY